MAAKKKGTRPGSAIPTSGDRTPMPSQKVKKQKKTSRGK